DVVATRELTVAVGTVVVGHPEHLAILGDSTPRLPLRGWSEVRCRCDIDGGTPRSAPIRRVSIKHIVVARWSGTCHRTVGITVCAAVAEVRPDKVEFATAVNGYRALYKVIKAIAIGGQALATIRTASRRVGTKWLRTEIVTDFDWCRPMGRLTA